MNEITKTGLDFCPCCNEKLDAVSSLADPEYKPNPNDLTVCMYCAAILVFEQDMALSEFSPIVFDTIHGETQMKLITTQVGLMKHLVPKNEHLQNLRKENIEKYASRVQE